MANSSRRAYASGMKMIALPLLLAACAPMTAPVGTLPDGPARIGQTVRVGGPTVRPLAIVEDSRCPADVQCVWAGRVVVRAEIGTGQGKWEMELTLGEPVHVADGMLTLREVSPGKLHATPIKPSDYRFRFDFAGSI